MNYKLHASLNEELNLLTDTELDELLDKVWHKIIEEEKLEKSISEADKLAVESIVKLCVKYGVINKIKDTDKINRLPEKEDQLVGYTARWLKKFILNRFNSFLTKEAKPLNERKVVRDQALSVVLSSYYKENFLEVSDEDIELSIDSHDLLMSIENMQGHLLEAYISSCISKAPYNFVWLDGEIVKAADFALEYKNNEQDELYLLQVKNKYNTENSSSVTVREGTTVNITKWYRLGISKVGGQYVPTYKWEDLNKAIEELCGNRPSMSESDYIDFLKNVVKRNPKIINI